MMLIDCRGGQRSFSRSANPLLQSLQRDCGLLADATDIGPAISPMLQLQCADAQFAGRIFAIGPVSRAGFWEVTAIPDIRVQADELSNQLLADSEAN